MENNEEQRQSNNVHLFQLAISNNFKKIAESVSEETFLDILTILKTKPNIVQKLHRAMFEELFQNMKEDLNGILVEGSLQEGLEKVAKLSDANSSVIEDAWRPPGDVSLHLRSLDAHVIKEECDFLEKQVNELEQKNAVLMQKITEKRSRLNTINNAIMRCLSRCPSEIDRIEERLQGLEQCLTILDNE